MAERTPELNGGDVKQRIPPTPTPSISILYVPPVSSIEENSVQSPRITDHRVDGELASHAGVSSASRSGNTELGDTARSIDSSGANLIVDQSHVSDYARNVNQCKIDIPVSTIQSPPGEGVNQEESHNSGPQECKSTVSRSPTFPLSTTDDKTETDVTDYDDVDEDSGMDVNTGLPPFSG